MQGNRLLAVLGVSGLALLSGCMWNGGVRPVPAPVEGWVPAAPGVQVQLIEVSAQTLPASIESTVAPEVAQLFQSAGSEYRLAVGDQVQIQLWAYPEITPATATTSYTVYSDGRIKFPLVGAIRAANKTLAEFHRDLEQALSRYLREPDVQVQVLKYQGRSVFVGGEVNKQGEYPLADRATSLYQAIGLAGGLTVQADRQRVRLIRNQRAYDLNVPQLEKQGYSLHRLLLRQGDTVQVLSREDKKAYVMGEVGKTTSVPIPEQQLSLTQLITESQGLNTLTAHSARVYVLRNPQQDQATLYHLDLSNLANMTLASRFMVEPNDIVYVDATGLARWSRVVNLLLPSASGLRTAQTIGNGN